MRCEGIHFDAGRSDWRPEAGSLGELLDRLGVSPKRVRLNRSRAPATERDVVRLHKLTQLVHELADDVFIEKVTGPVQQAVARRLAEAVHGWWVGRGGGGMILTEGTALKLADGLVRAPDVSFTDWSYWATGRVVPVDPVPGLMPDLVADVQSPENTHTEMLRKLNDYFGADVNLVWYIDPRKRTVRVFTSPDDVTELGEADTLDGGDVLPGFAVEVARLFDQLAPAAKPAKPKANGKKPKKRK